MSQPPQQGQVSSDEQQRLVEQFDSMEKNQLDFLDAAGKSMIERIATFLAVLFGVTVLSSTFPPLYLKNNDFTKITATITLLFFLGALAAGLFTIQPRKYKRYHYDLGLMRQQLDTIRHYKATWLRWASILFGLGSVALVVLIIAIIWQA